MKFSKPLLLSVVFTHKAFEIEKTRLIIINTEIWEILMTFLATKLNQFSKFLPFKNLSTQANIFCRMNFDSTVIIISTRETLFASSFF